MPQYYCIFIQVYCGVFRYLFEGPALSSKEAVKLTRRVEELKRAATFGSN